MDKYEAADLIVAAYAHACDYHGGMFTPLYARLCALGKTFKPGAAWRGIESEGDGQARCYYDDLVAAGGDLPMEAEVQEALAILETAEF